ncbi:OprO/OprP family phosphate-selective porin [Corallococcus sp. M34]|uniref:OprO/OprP family phosphate-selective porin n=1 Tax=Citreicoccus inhibens TaxID=2849499 RepID=UPI001C22642B|nr:OprO/OprP family phosphate-selective porin [Citreicoccus inhibens]MBU8894849.1 OprO/OprP family phosphate-selective porin [Citreicoccus inhibens]
MRRWWGAGWVVAGWMGLMGLGARAEAQQSDPPVENPLSAVPEGDASASQEGAKPPAAEGTGGSGTSEDSGASDEKKDAPPKTGFTKEKGFRIVSDDGNYSLGIGLQSAYKLEPVWVDGKGQSRTAFPFLRPRLFGTIYRPWISFWTSLELASPLAPYLLDSFIDLQPFKPAGLRVGQYYTPLSRHESWGPQQILFPEFAPVANYFWTGRDKGITFLGTTDTLEYYAGIYSGSPLRSIRSMPGRWVSNLRLTVSPMGPMGYGELPYIMSGKEGAPFRVSFTVQGAGGKIEQIDENFNIESGVFQLVPKGPRKFVTGGVDLMVQAQRFTFFGEAYLRRTEPEGDGAPRFTSVGAWVQADYVVYKKVVDVGVRLSFLNPSTELAHDLLYIEEVQLAWFVDAPTLAFKLRYQLAHQQSPDPALVGDVQLAKDVGTTNVITLQVNLAF